LKTWWPGTELNRRRRPFQGCSHPKISVDSARLNSDNLHDFDLFIGAKMEPSSTNLSLPRFASSRHALLDGSLQHVFHRTPGANPAAEAAGFAGVSIGKPIQGAGPLGGGSDRTGRPKDRRPYPLSRNKGASAHIRSDHGFEDIVGESKALHKVLEQVAIVAPRLDGASAR